MEPTVFVLAGYIDFADGRVLGAYSTPEKAEEAKATYKTATRGRDFDELAVHEIQIDAAPEVAG